MKNTKTQQRLQAVAPYKPYRELFRESAGVIFENLDAGSFAEISRITGKTATDIQWAMEGLEDRLAHRKSFQMSFDEQLTESRCKDAEHRQWLKENQPRLDAERAERDKEWERWYAELKAKRARRIAAKLERARRGPHFTKAPKGRFAKNVTNSRIIHSIEDGRLLCWTGSDEAVRYSTQGEGFAYFNRAVKRVRETYQKNRNINQYILGDADFLTCKRCISASNNLGLHTD